MTFSPLVPRVAIAVTELQVLLMKRNDGDKQAAYHVEIAYGDGTRETLHGNLGPHLTSAQLASLESFMTALLAQATDQLIPR